MSLSAWSSAGCTFDQTGSFTASQTNTNFTVSVNPAGFPAGTTCTGTITMTAGSVTKTASVTLNVTAAATAGLTLDRKTLALGKGADLAGRRSIKQKST